MALPLNLSSKKDMEDNKQGAQPVDGNKEKFQTDTQRLVQKHMADPDHQITDEDLAAVRVGMSPGPDAPTKQAIEDADERVADAKTDSEDDIVPGAQKITPWDLTS
jgi:hypothetical protein